jgi:predicted metal-dependent phosphoesterase TrpH
MPLIDLHTHSHYSDGTAEPAEVVRRAHAVGVRLMVLSDHDTTDGWLEAKAEADQIGMDLRPGVEINTVDDSIHLLGYGIDPTVPTFQARLAEFRSRRERRIGRALEKLREAGIDIQEADLKSVSRQTLGRPHIADALRRKNVVSSRREAFERFLVKGKPGYVEPMGPSFTEAVETIKLAGGFPVLAHPSQLKNGAWKPELWIEKGLIGIEAYYLGHSAAYINELLEHANIYGWIATGGSDFHGPGSGRDKIGGVDVPEALFQKLRSML